jgi:hypothetical protein
LARLLISRAAEICYARVGAVHRLRIHDFDEAAEEALRRAIAWLESRPAEERLNQRRPYGQALFFAGRHAEAQRIFDTLVDENTTESTWLRGGRGVIAATRGDTSQATADLVWLENLRDPSVKGSPTFFQAAIASALGKREHAMNLLSAAFAQGYHYGWITGQREWLASLEGYPAFEEFMRPKG